MAKRVKKPGAYPDWLFEKDGPKGPLFPWPYCVWTCTGCGAPYFYRQRAGKHGGPAWRIKDHPEWSPFEGPCWRSHDYGVKCVTPRGVRVLVHEGKDPPGEELMKALAKNARAVRRRLSKDNIDHEEGK